MTGVTVTQSVTINDRDMLEQLSSLVEHMDNPMGFYKNVGEYLLNSIHDNFDREETPAGMAWQGLKEKTKLQREKKRLTPIRILRARGRLAGSFSSIATPTEVRVGTPVPYAAIHNFGGDIEQPARKQTIYQRYDEKTDTIHQKFVRKSRSNFARDVDVGAHTITMPARQFAGVSQEGERIILGIAQDWLRAEAGRQK